MSTLPCNHLPRRTHPAALFNTFTVCNTHKQAACTNKEMHICRQTSFGEIPRTHSPSLIFRVSRIYEWFILNHSLWGCCRIEPVLRLIIPLPFCVSNLWIHPFSLSLSGCTCVFTRKIRRDRGSQRHGFREKEGQIQCVYCKLASCRTQPWGLGWVTLCTCKCASNRKGFSVQQHFS